MNIKRVLTARNMAEKTLWRRIVEIIVGLAVAFFIGGILIWVAGGDPLLGILKIIEGGLGGQRQIASTLTKATPLLLVSIGISVAFNVKLIFSRRRVPPAALGTNFERRR